MRNVLLDYPDDKCLKILSNLITAMGPKSVLLIDELILPTRSSAPVMATALDITMMAGLKVMERTESDWLKLLGRVGLQVTRIYMYDQVMGYGIIEAVPRHLL